MTDPPESPSLADRVIGHYDTHAHAWDDDRRASVWNDKPWHDRFIAALPRGGTVLDLGCGGGSPVAENLVAHGYRVTGVDASPTLVALCRARMPDQTWIVGDMRTLALDATFDGILAWDSFFHLTPGDQRAMFAIFTAHAASSAILMFNTGPAAGEAIGCYRGDKLFHASLDAADYRALLARSGFACIAHAIEDWNTGGGRTVWLCRASR